MAAHNDLNLPYNHTDPVKLGVLVLHLNKIIKVGIDACRHHSESSSYVTLYCGLSREHIQNSTLNNEKNSRSRLFPRRSWSSSVHEIRESPSGLNERLLVFASLSLKILKHVFRDIVVSLNFSF